MRILLIGGNGFIGAPLARELRDAGHEVAIFHRRPSVGPGEEDFRFIQGDRNHLADYRGRLRDFAPDVIVDIVLSSGKQARELVETVRGIAPRVVAISSMDVYRAWGVLLGVEPGLLEPLPLTEESPLRTVRQIYPPEKVRALQSSISWLDEQYDKIAVESAIMNGSEVTGTVLRLPMVYGPGDMFHRLLPVLKRVKDGRTVIILSDEFASWRAPRGFVDNVAHAIAIAATSDEAAGRIYNICDEPTLSELDWQKSIARELEWSGRFVLFSRGRTPKHLLPPGNTAQHVVASSARIRTELGYAEPVALDEAILRTIAWEQHNPPATIDPQQFDYAAEDSALMNAA